MSLVCFILCQVANKNAAGRENPVQFFAIFKANVTTKPQVRGKPTVFRVFHVFELFNGVRKNRPPRTAVGALGALH